MPSFGGSDYDRNAQLRKNKRKGTAMEKSVSKIVSGHRVPMSGGGSIKADVIAPSKMGQYIIECKYTSNKDGRLIFMFDWLAKFEAEVKYMTMRFGIFVLNFDIDKHKFYALARSDWMARLYKELDVALLDVIEIQGKRSITIPQKTVEHYLQQSKTGMIRILMGEREFICMHLSRFVAIAQEGLIMDEDEV